MVKNYLKNLNIFDIIIVLAIIFIIIQGLMYTGILGSDEKAHQFTVLLSVCGSGSSCSNQIPEYLFREVQINNTLRNRDVSSQIINVYSDTQRLYVELALNTTNPSIIKVGRHLALESNRYTLNGNIIDFRENGELRTNINFVDDLIQTQPILLQNQSFIVTFRSILSNQDRFISKDDTIHLLNTHTSNIYSIIQSNVIQEVFFHEGEYVIVEHPLQREIIFSVLVEGLRSENNVFIDEHKIQPGNQIPIRIGFSTYTAHIVDIEFR